MKRVRRLVRALFRSPVLWGLLATLGFYALIRSGPLAHAGVLRYFDGHWVENIEAAAFFVGLAALVIKAFDIGGQFSLGRTSVLGPTPEGGQPIPDVASLLERLEGLPDAWKESYLVARFRAALEFVARKQSLDGLDDELRYLADLDVARMQASYALVKIIIWAIPILGFLGTVIGITIAIANLSPEALESSLPAVTGGLGTAFDTTALALGLCMVLMLVQYLVDKFESRLLAQVDAQTARELVGRFQDAGSATDPLVVSVRRMAETVVRATERLVVQQTELWKSTVEAAHQQWNQLSQASGKQLESALTSALQQSLNDHVMRLTAAEEMMAASNREHWQQMQQSLVKTAEAITTGQHELARQSGLLSQVVDATAQLEKLESALNRNLGALAGSKNFEDTVMSLSAAIHLLTARLSNLPDSKQVDLSVRRTSQAA